MCSACWYMCSARHLIPARLAHFPHQLLWVPLLLLNTSSMCVYTSMSGSVPLRKLSTCCRISSTSSSLRVSYDTDLRFSWTERLPSLCSYCSFINVAKAECVNILFAWQLHLKLQFVCYSVNLTIFVLGAYHQKHDNECKHDNSVIQAANRGLYHKYLNNLSLLIHQPLYCACSILPWDLQFPARILSGVTEKGRVL